MSIRRFRSGGMHANSEEEYLNKIVKLERQQKKKTLDQEDEYFDGFIVNSEFNFDCIEQPQLSQINQKSHFILIMVDDLELSPKRLQNMLEYTDNCETMTQSTNDDSSTWSSQIMDHDLIIHTYKLDCVNHLFNIWIINTKNINSTFKYCYFQLFEAFICINNVNSIVFQEVFSQIKEINSDVQQFHIKENDEVSSERKQFNNLQSILKTLIDSKSY
ncbi:unnamed protein product [Paramecium sonneborni]|uniref:Uncharacterized protein n=1 Tax=Paramecium sonneborni TaxID=65129 RepID=A0A8S1MAV6_9CILI|nr:unnamed protein product [Paramecium sonneborni]